MGDVCIRYLFELARDNYKIGRSDCIYEIAGLINFVDCANTKCTGKWF